MKKIITVSLSLVMIFTAFLPGAVLAQDASQTIGADGGLNSDDPSKGSAFQIVPCGTKYDASGAKTGVDCDFNQLLNMVNRVIKFLLYLSIPLILGIIIFTAFKFLTANGDPGKLADAKKMLIPVFIGLFWVLAAYIVVYTVLDKLLSDSVKTGSNGIFNQYFKK